MSELEQTAERLERIRAQIRAAEARVGREGRTVLVAAVKYADAAQIAELVRLGVCNLGENRVQQLLQHSAELEQLGVTEARFHFIGTLQRNKVKYIADRVVMIHSVDSLSLGAEIERQMKRRDRVMDILVEINSGSEADKSGVAPQDAAALCSRLVSFSHLRLRGFMTMAPKCEKTEDYRKYFQETYKLGLDIWQKTLHNIGSPIFSMGMSDSFSVAIEEGADLVRIGRALVAPHGMIKQNADQSDPDGSKGG